MAPWGIISAGHHLRDAQLVGAAVGVGLLSSALPWSLELEALRRLPSHVFSVVLSLEPAVAALAGFVFLHEHLRTRRGSRSGSSCSRAPAPRGAGARLSARYLGRLDVLVDAEDVLRVVLPLDPREAVVVRAVHRAHRSPVSCIWKFT